MNKYLLILILVSISSCQNSEFQILNCLDAEYGELIGLAELEFKQELRTKYNTLNEEQNLLKYLRDINTDNIDLVKPSQNLKTKLIEQKVIEDIWNIDQTPNLNGNFATCLRNSEQQFLLEYYDRLENIGDMSPSIVARGLEQYISSNGINNNVYLVAVVNFYIITVNQNEI